MRHGRSRVSNGSGTVQASLGSLSGQRDGCKSSAIEVVLETARAGLPGDALEEPVVVRVLDGVERRLRRRHGVRARGEPGTASPARR